MATDCRRRARKSVEILKSNSFHSRNLDSIQQNALMTLSELKKNELLTYKRVEKVSQSVRCRFFLAQNFFGIYIFSCLQCSCVCVVCVCVVCVLCVCCVCVCVFASLFMCPLALQGLFGPSKLKICSKDESPNLNFKTFFLLKFLSKKVEKILALA